MAAYIKFLAGHLEKQEYRYYKKNELTCTSKMFGATTLFLTDFTSVEVATEESVKKLGGSLGGAVIGGLLLGGVGAIVGGMSSGATTESTIICTFKSGQRSLAKVNSPMFEAIQAHLFNLEQNPHYADDTDKPKKMALWKKIALVLIALSVLSALFGKRDQSATPSTGTAQSNPCANTSTMDDWNKASALWRMTNSQCKPRE